MSLHTDWVYDGQDPMLILFTHAVQLWGLDIPAGSRVLELGCCETDWAPRLKRTVDCHVTGIDVRACPDYGGDRFTQADASDPRRFEEPWLEPGSFDVVISLGAIEHFGLGWHEYGDPVNPKADTQAISNAWQWLKPGGTLYFDVPWTPTVHHETAHYRVYSDETLRSRFTQALTWRARGWAPNERERDDFTQVRPMAEHHPFYFVALMAEKPK